MAKPTTDIQNFVEATVPLLGDLSYERNVEDNLLDDVRDYAVHAIYIYLGYLINELLLTSDLDVSQENSHLIQQYRSIASSIPIGTLVDIHNENPELPRA